MTEKTIMPIRAHLPEVSSFDPEAIEAMSKAFVDACTVLHVFAGDKRGRESIAARIIDLQWLGTMNPEPRTSNPNPEHEPGTRNPEPGTGNY